MSKEVKNFNKKKRKTNTLTKLYWSFLFIDSIFSYSDDNKHFKYFTLKKTFEFSVQNENQYRCL